MTTSSALSSSQIPEILRQYHKFCAAHSPEFVPGEEFIFRLPNGTPAIGWIEDGRNPQQTCVAEFAWGKKSLEVSYLSPDERVEDSFAFQDSCETRDAVFGPGPINGLPCDPRLPPTGKNFQTLEAFLEKANQRLEWFAQNLSAPTPRPFDAKDILVLNLFEGDGKFEMGVSHPLGLICIGEAEPQHGEMHFTCIDSMNGDELHSLEKFQIRDSCSMMKQLFGKKELPSGPGAGCEDIPPWQQFKEGMEKFLSVLPKAYLLTEFSMSALLYVLGQTDPSVSRHIQRVFPHPFPLTRNIARVGLSTTKFGARGIASFSSQMTWARAGWAGLAFAAGFVAGMALDHYLPKAWGSEKQISDYTAAGLTAVFGPADPKGWLIKTADWLGGIL